MKQILSFICFSFILLGCDNNDEITPVEENRKLIKSIQIDTHNTDSLYYNNDKKVVSITTFTFGKEYKKTNYKYNTKGQLSEISFPLIPSSDNLTDKYIYNSDGSLKSRKKDFVNFGGTINTVTYNYTYSENKITITDDDYRNKTHIRIVTLDSKNRVKSIERQKISLDSYFTYFEYTYDNKGNVIKLNYKDNETAEVVEYNFEYDNKINPFPVLDFKLPNGQTIKKLESISNDFILPFNGISLGNYNDFLNFQNTNNVTQIKNINLNSSYNYLYNDNDYPISISYKYSGNNNTTLKLTYE